MLSRMVYHNITTMIIECYVEQNGVTQLYYNDNRNILVIIFLPDRLLDIGLCGAQ